jgi:hypothetical protein
LAIVFLNSSGAHLSLQVSGELKRSEVAEAQALAAVAAKQWGKVSVLVILEDFNGWAPGEDWADLVFARDHDHEIEKLAIVGLEAWRDLVYAFTGRGLRSVAIEYFLPAEIEKAKQWLGIEKA